MASTYPTGRVQSQTSSVIAATVLLIAIVLLLAGLATNVITMMIDSANEIDDARAERAAQTAITTLATQVGTTVNDNAVWDDAYAAISSSRAADWAYENWGKTSTDYALYDGAIVIGPDGNIVSAFAKGKPFQPRDYFGAPFDHQIQIAAIPQTAPLLSYFKIEGGIAIVASQAVQPFESAAKPLRPSVLTFYKVLTPEVIDRLSKLYELDGLQLAPAPLPRLLSAAITDIDGKPLAYLVWPSKAPGSAVLSQVYPYIVAASGVLALFLVIVLAAGTSEARRLRRLAEAARFEASHDSLSGLLNRHGLLQLLGQSENMMPSIALYMIDLDGFKAINDAWGHDVGDELISLVARALKDCHPEIHAAARLGSDEFALIQHGAAPHCAIEESILRVFSEPFKIGGRTIEVGAGIGVAYHTGTIVPMELLRRADMALHHAKEIGKGRAVPYDLELDRERLRLAEMEAELRKAISEGAIAPVFQPLVCASSGRIIGVEALARWRSGAGSISPEVFVALAEKSGLIDALGVHMLRASLVHAKGWPPLTLSVNISPIQLCNPDFAAHVMTVLQESDFDARRLTLEITEGVLMTNPDQARRSIDQLKNVGIKFALDDFGCGYASIGALRQFGFDRMKIDRSLVSGLEEKSKGIDILRATVALANALDIPVTAEGVETEQQAEILRDLGCDQLQGYLVGKPMSASEIHERLLREGGAA